MQIRCVDCSLTYTLKLACLINVRSAAGCLILMARLKLIWICLKMICQASGDTGMPLLCSMVRLLCILVKGNTPLLWLNVDGRTVGVKVEGQNPSGSFKGPRRGGDHQPACGAGLCAVQLRIHPAMQGHRLRRMRQRLVSMPGFFVPEYGRWPEESADRCVWCGVGAGARAAFGSS